MTIGEVGEDYPASLPLIAASCPNMKFSFLKHITVELSKRIEDMEGMQTVHWMIETLTELLAEAATKPFEAKSEGLLLILSIVLNYSSRHSHETDRGHEIPQPNLRRRKVIRRRESKSLRKK